MTTVADRQIAKRIRRIRRNVVQVPVCPPWHRDCWPTNRHLDNDGPVPMHHRATLAELVNSDNDVHVGVRWEQIDGAPAACVIDVGSIPADLDREELAQVTAALVLAWARILAPKADQTAAVDAVLALLRAEATDLLADQQLAQYRRAEVGDDDAA